MRTTTVVRQKAESATRGASWRFALRAKIVPPTTNYEHPDPECDLDCVANLARTVKVTGALSNSMGFGGHNASLVLIAP